jgi:hypothetical protein
MVSQRRTATDVVAEYRAELTVFTVQSSFHLIGDITDPRVVQAIVTRPSWMPYEWEPSADPTRAELERLALTKLLTIFEFGAGLETNEPFSIREALLAAHPLLLEEQVSGGRDWKHITVKSRIFIDGGFEGGFEYPEEGIPIPLRDLKESTVDHFIKNMVRADMREAIEARTSGWQAANSVLRPVSCA